MDDENLNDEAWAVAAKSVEPHIAMLLARGAQHCSAEELWDITRAAITAYQAEAWQDISTADKGSGWKLLFSTSEGQDVGRWEPSYGVDGDWMDAQGYTIWNVTHWQPLPPPPEGSGQNLADANSKSPIQAREE